MCRLAKFMLFMAVATVVGCSSDPDSTLNRIPPIPQLDAFFRSLRTGAPAASASYDNRPAVAVTQPGYAPAYPPYPIE